MSDEKPHDASEGSIGQSASTDGLEDSAVLNEAFEMWVEAMMPSFKVLRPRERTIAKSAFRCAWQAREVYERMSSNVQVEGAEGSLSNEGLERMTVDEIEGCFPERGATTDDDSIICSAQWLHDFAHNVAALEREACAKVCDSLAIDGIKADQTGWCAEIIRDRSNV